MRRSDASSSHSGFPPVQRPNPAASSPGFPPVRQPGPAAASNPGFPAVQRPNPAAASNPGFPPVQHPDPAASSPGFAPAHGPQGGQSEQVSWLARYNQPDPEPAYGSRAYVPQQSRPQPKPEESLRNVWQQVNPPPARQQAEPSHRHRAEPEEESGGGRRRRAAGQPSWQETVGRAAEEQPGGSHAWGRSVSELLANHGLDANPRRRRRRED